MSYALSPPSAWQKSGFFGVVLAGHVLLLTALSLTKSVVPAVPETPLIVDWLSMASTAAPSAAQPKAQPLPIRREPTPRSKVGPQRTSAVNSPAPAIETTSSALASPNAVATPESARSESSGAAVGANSAASGATGASRAADAGSGEISQARFDAGYLRNPAPPYPAVSRRMGEEGKVILRVLVSAQGTAESVEIRTSSGSARLDESALKTVRQWKFVPAKRGETPIQSSVLVPIIFKLEQ